MSDFNPGDRVRVNYTSVFDQLKGKMGTVVKTVSSNHVSVRFDNGEQIGFYPRSLDLIPPETPAVGMSSKDLADAVEATIRQTRERVEGVGDAQYSTAAGQKFEGLKVSELLRMAREEAQDLVVYAVMTDIRLARIEKAIEGEGL